MTHKQSDEDLFADSTMTFGEHLEELRICLWRAILGLIAGIIIGMFLGGQVVNLIQRPLTNALSHYYQRETEAKIAALTGQNGDNAKNEKEILEAAKSRGMIADDVYVDPRELLAKLDTAHPQELPNIQLPEKSMQGKEDGLIHILLWRKSADDPRVHLKSFSVWEGFGIYVKAAFLVGLLLASPWIFYQIWTFVAAGLYPHEKHYVHFYLPISIGLFFFGACVAFSFVFEPVLNFLFSVNKWLGIDLDPRISEWIGFALILPVGFGIGFQLPLVMYFLERVGIVSAGMFAKHWKIAVLLIWVLATLLTPPDPFSQFFLGIPLTFLYFGGILLCKYVPRRRSGEWRVESGEG
ncbi:MAG: twin-arginine translocase subunit TatC [Thermoguttaceae bacterium]|jgi:sec-independent protein translocase protein TatC